jgi:hypothetical protein
LAGSGLACPHRPATLVFFKIATMDAEVSAAPSFSHSGQPLKIAVRPPNRESLHDC